MRYIWTKLPKIVTRSQKKYPNNPNRIHHYIQPVTKYPNSEFFNNLILSALPVFAIVKHSVIVLSNWKSIREWHGKHILYICVLILAPFFSLLTLNAQTYWSIKKMVEWKSETDWQTGVFFHTFLVNFWKLEGMKKLRWIFSTPTYSQPNDFNKWQVASGHKNVLPSVKKIEKQKRDLNFGI